MITVSDYRDVPAAACGAAIALGNFDGVHRGHQVVLDAARTAAHARGAPFGVAVFKPHPRRFFQPLAAPFRLTSNEFRARLLGEFGADVLFEIPFVRDLSLKDDAAFVREVLADGMGVSHVAIGFDYRFGKDRVGDAGSLSRLGADAGIGVTVVDEVADGGAKCSSTAIRQALETGDVATAEALLTRPWIVDGHVERGDQRGRTIGYPTANVPLGVLKRPKFGVYAVEARVDGEGGWRPGVANVGVRPTFDGTEERVEVHLFDVDEDLYGRRLDVAFRAFIRDERKFDGVEALKAQIALDSVAARAAL